MLAPASRSFEMIQPKPISPNRMRLIAALSISSAYVLHRQNRSVCLKKQRDAITRGHSSFPTELSLRRRGMPDASVAPIARTIVPRIESRIVAPNVAVKFLFARSGQYAANLSSRNLLHLSDLSRDPMQLSCFFQSESGNRRVLD